MTIDDVEKLESLQKQTTAIKEQIAPLEKDLIAKINKVVELICDALNVDLDYWDWNPDEPLDNVQYINDDNWVNIVIVTAGVYRHMRVYEKGFPVDYLFMDDEAIKEDVLRSIEPEDVPVKQEDFKICPQHDDYKKIKHKGRTIATFNNDYVSLHEMHYSHGFLIQIMDIIKQERKKK